MNGIKAYVDGSFDPRTGTYGYGVAFVNDGGEIMTYGGAGNDRQIAHLRNVAGEMKAALVATKIAMMNGYDSIEICYDYEGIEHWVTRTWKAKKSMTSEYASTMRRWGKDIAISFRKCKAHTGDKLNDLADATAKRAVAEFDGFVFG